jgi:hypothetical protein
MDILSLSKTSKVLKNVKQLDESVVAPLAEDRFPTVDARLDWLEGQAAKIKVENSNQLDLSQGVFENTETVNGKIQLKLLSQSDLGYTENLIPTKTISDLGNYPWAISSYPGNAYMYRWFDKTATTGPGHTTIGLPAWVKIDTGAGNEVQIEKIALTASNYGWPYDWKFEASDTGEFSGEQIVLYENSAEPYKAENEKLEITFSNPRPYRYYRIYCSQSYANLSNTLSGNRIQLLEFEAMSRELVNIYSSNGTWESPIIDLGEGWKETKLVDIVKQIHTGTTNVSFEIATSTDGISFTSYTPLDPSNPLQGRYIKIRATLSAPAQPGEVKTLDFNQSSPENMMILNEYTEANGKLQLKNTYTYNMTDDGTLGAGKQFSVAINKANFKSIESIGVN